MENEIVNKNNQELDIIKFEWTELPTKTDLSLWQKIPIGEIGTLSIPVMEAITAVSNAGGSGLYMVDTAGGTLFECASKGAGVYIGGMKTASGEIAQAALKPVVFNPMTLGMTMAMMGAMIKLNEINENTLKIIDKLERKDKAVIQSAFKKLIETVEGYKASSDKEKYIENNLQTVNSYIAELDKLREEYKDELMEMSKKTSMELTADKYIKEVVYKYNLYQMIIYVLAMAMYIQTLYNKDYSESYLEMVNERYDKLNEEQKILFANCKEGIEKKYGSAAVKKLSDAGEFILSGMSNMPVVGAFITGGVSGIMSKFGADKGLEILKKQKSSSDKKTKEAIDQVNISAVLEFKSKIDNLNSLYNKPFEMVVDKEYAYIRS